MKIRTLIANLLIMIIIISLTSCTDNPTKSKNDSSKIKNFILCEGNFGNASASLWEYNEEEVVGPIHWDQNTDPLGDVGQSMTIHDNKLYLIINNSHSIEILNLDDEITYNSTIELPGTSPRFMEVNNNTGYVTCWNINGILKIDLVTNTITDTIPVGGMPEDIIIKNNKIYTSIQMKPDWTINNKVLEIDITSNTPVITKTYEVIEGPSQILLKNDEIYVASTYYDASWNTYAGMSKINLSTDEVTIKNYGVNFDFSGDLISHDDKIYRAYKNGIVEIKSDLNYDDSEKIGDLNGNVYSLALNEDKLFCGCTDYVAPDTVFVLDMSGEIIDELTVGALPGSFSFYNGE